MNEDTELEIAPVAHNFTIIYHQTSRDKRLSWGARGLLAYMLSHSAGFRVTVKSLIRQWDYEALGMYVSGGGRSAIHKMLNELKAAGYIETRQLTKNGRYSGVKYIVHSVAKEPQEKTPEVDGVRISERGNSESRNSEAGKPERFKNNNLLEEQEYLEEKRESIAEPTKEHTPTPKNLQGFNAIWGTGDNHLSTEQRAIKGQLFNTIKALVRDPRSVVNINEAADAVLELGVSADDLKKWYSPGGWWFTQGLGKKDNAKPYAKNIFTSIDEAHSHSRPVNLTPVKLTPADVLAALAPLRGLQNGALREAINQLPAHIKGTAGKAVKNYRDATGVHYELQNLTLEILKKGMEA